MILHKMNDFLCSSEIYGDGVLLFTSVDMNHQKSRQEIRLDISNVDILRIQYPDTLGPNEIATLFDMYIA